MKLYLMRHGTPLSDLEDPTKPLSPHGKDEVEKMAKFLVAKGVPPLEILHSNRLRAKETAQIIGNFLAKEIPPKVFSPMGPSDPIEPLLTEIEGREKDLLIISHLPFLEKLISTLATEKEEALLIQFQTAMVVCLEKKEGEWKIGFALGPDEIT